MFDHNVIFPCRLYTTYAIYTYEIEFNLTFLYV